MNTVNLILMIFFGVAALAVGVLMAVFVLPEKRKKTFSGFLLFVRDIFNFKIDFTEMIVKIITVAGCVFSFVFGFVYTFTGFAEHAFGGVEWVGYSGLMLMFGGTISWYLFGSLVLRFIRMADNVVELNKKTARTAKPEPEHVPVQPRTPEAAPVQESAPKQRHFCGRCGASVDESGKCPSCDK